ncbi:MAG: helix-turn-helix domain-containing protein [Alphaproteobacteria bacterium]
MDNLIIKISETLKSLRRAKGWSLDIASQKTGVSKAMLGQIERAESSPTISTLWKIASGFETSFSSFIEDNIKYSPTTIHRTNNPTQIHPDDDKIKVTSLFPYDDNLCFEVFIIELLPGCVHLSPSHTGNVVEHVIVTEGKMEVLINNIWHKIKSNEGLRFNADQPHGYRNTSNQKACFHDIIHYNKIK